MNTDASSTAERTGLSPFEVLALDTQLDEEMPCEHYQHPTHSRWHAGPGKWYAMTKCFACGFSQNTVYLVCDKWIQTSKAEGDLVCDLCGDIATFDECFVIVERK